MTEENILALMSTGMEILASYYTDICQNDYPAAGEMPAIDPLAAALGSKLTYRPESDLPETTIIYRNSLV
ncbi:MAG: hypothetical protein LUF92_02555, partial [Clostridiales bacterium]|nr:hypothetical protein [Clostridiales bacterium]